MNITYNVITPQIIHFHSTQQTEITKLFVRIQEFYESPYPEIKGKYFSIQKFASAYKKDHDSFSYYTDWAGFNIPGNVVNEFFKVFKSKLTKREKFMLSALKPILNKKFYIIGSSGRHNDLSDLKNKYLYGTLQHEIAHALYYLNPTYKKKCKSIYSKIKDNEKLSIRKKLLFTGYCDNVVEDETQAYLSTTTTVLGVKVVSRISKLYSNNLNTYLNIIHKNFRHCE